MGNSGDGAHTGREKLKGNIGVFKLVCIVLAFNAPLGVVNGVVPLVLLGGISGPLIFLGLGVFLLIFAVGMMAVAIRIPASGGFYSFVTAGLGKIPGLAASFTAILTYFCFLVVALAIGGVSYERFFVSMGAPLIPWWVWALVMGATTAILGVLQIDFTGRILAAVVVIEVVLVLIWEARVMQDGGATGRFTFESFDPALLTTGGLVMGVVFGFISLGGFESTSVYRDEARDYKRTIPRATYISIVVVTVFTAFATWVMVQALGTDGLAVIADDPTAVFPASVDSYAGRVAHDMVLLFIATSSFAGMASLHNVTARYMFNLGRDGIIPRSLGRVHPKFGSPYVASIALSTACFAILLGAILTGQPGATLYTTTAGICGYSFVVLLLLASLGIAAYLMRTRLQELSVWTRIVAPVFSAVAMVVIVVVVTTEIELLTGTPTYAAIALTSVLAAIALGVIVGWVSKRWRPEVYQLIGTQDEL
ncbi:APC family permease [Mycolicibacterium litorale]|uniref:APC family permease n=1 Tax=Mycolicibacterium litorale TaxID=758802 RepID=UPI003CE90EF5